MKVIYDSKAADQKLFNLFHSSKKSNHTKAISYTSFLSSCTLAASALTIVISALLGNIAHPALYGTAFLAYLVYERCNKALKKSPYAGKWTLDTIYQRYSFWGGELVTSVSTKGEKGTVSFILNDVNLGEISCSQKVTVTEVDQAGEDTLDLDTLHLTKYLRS